jgi:hypothetical protein
LSIIGCAGAPNAAIRKKIRPRICIFRCHDLEFR